MADVTGPISSLPNSHHTVPEGTMCDDHPDRPAVARVQGETDSFGSEMNDMCQECLDNHKAYLASDEAAESRKGVCDWCKNTADDLRPKRDFEEGMSGRVYDVCGACVSRQNEELADELDDDYADCWDCGGDGYVSSCHSEYACLNAEDGCDECTRTCSTCRGQGVL